MNNKEPACRTSHETTLMNFDQHLSAILAPRKNSCDHTYILCLYPYYLNEEVRSVVMFKKRCFATLSFNLPTILKNHIQINAIFCAIINHHYRIDNSSWTHVKTCFTVFLFDSDAMQKTRMALFDIVSLCPTKLFDGKMHAKRSRIQGIVWFKKVASTTSWFAVSAV